MTTSSHAFQLWAVPPRRCSAFHPRAQILSLSRPMKKTWALKFPGLHVSYLGGKSLLLSLCRKIIHDHEEMGRKHTVPLHSLCVQFKFTEIRCVWLSRVSSLIRSKLKLGHVNACRACKGNFIHTFVLSIAILYSLMSLQQQRKQQQNDAATMMLNNQLWGLMCENIISFTVAVMWLDFIL